MITEDIKVLLLNNFYSNFASEVSTIIIKNQAVDLLYNLVVSRHIGISKTDESKIIFRAAYVLETIYFKDESLFTPFSNRFFSDFTKCVNASAKRHFCKIMLNLLSKQKPSFEECDLIAQKCVEWAIEPKTKVAVRILSIKILFLLRKNIKWIDESLSDIIYMTERCESPAIQCNIKKWKFIR